MVMCICVRGPTLARLATVSVLLEAGGKPSTRFPPEGLVELTYHARKCHFIVFFFIEKMRNFKKS